MSEILINRISESLRQQNEIKKFLAFSDHDRARAWTEPMFNRNFPFMTIYLLSEEGRKTFDANDREGMLSSCLKVFGDIPWSPKIHNQQRMPYVPSVNFSFTRNGEVTSGSKLHMKETDSLLRTNIAAILLLGMSLPEEKGKNKLFKFYKSLDKNKKNAFSRHIDLLLTTNNASRAWIKDNDLDKSANFDWDTELSKIILTLPENKIDPEKQLPKKLSSTLLNANLSTLYSNQTLEMFLEYVYSYAMSLERTHTRDIDILGFTENLPLDFISDPARRLRIDLLKKRIGIKPKNY
ncbi:MAG: hypothetical protein Q8P26_02275 [Candidatus Levybacteria bacterium]|nr:hypothetical protein [Candidatus Levybacteria bacterium]